MAVKGPGPSQPLPYPYIVTYADGAQFEPKPLVGLYYLGPYPTLEGQSQAKAESRYYNRMLIYKMYYNQTSRIVCIKLIPMCSNFNETN